MTDMTWLQAQLVKRQLRQVDLSKLTGIGQSHVSELVRGKRIPQAKTCRRIANAFGLDPVQVFISMRNNESKNLLGPCKI